MQSPRIKLVTFDALHTILTPRLPIQVQYARVLKQYLGQQLDPKLLKSSMKTGHFYRNSILTNRYEFLY